MGRKKLIEPPPPDFWESSVADAFNMPSWLGEVSVFEAAFIGAFFAYILLVWFYGKSTKMKSEATLNMRNLNRVNLFKECFLAYLGAGMLEPIMAIANEGAEASAKSLALNLCQLLGLFSWLFLLSDAFDISDTQQAFVYWTRIQKVVENDKTKKMPPWLKQVTKNEKDVDIRGSFVRDLALWFMLLCSAAAFCGICSHHDVIHSHAITLLWVILHHQARAATAWRGTGYLHTLFAPSTALLPLEYCLNLIDQEMIGDDGLDDIQLWHEFIQTQCGVKLIIEF